MDQQTIPEGAPEIKTIGLTEFHTLNNRSFKRKKGTTQWSEISDSTPPLPPAQLSLSLVRETQADGEPNHWSLYGAREGQGGKVYQVTGDAEHMSYVPETRTTGIHLSENFRDMYELAGLDEEQSREVQEVAADEAPPRAENRRSVTENCQGWAVRVIEKLVARRIDEAAQEFQLNIEAESKTRCFIQKTGA